MVYEHLGDQVITYFLSNGVERSHLHHIFLNYENVFYFEHFLNMNGEYTNQFQELHYLCALEESEKHDLVRYIRGLRSDIWDNMNFYQNIQEENIVKLPMLRINSNTI